MHGGEAPLQLHQQDAEERLGAESSRVRRTLIVHDDLLIALQLQLQQTQEEEFINTPDVRSVSLSHHTVGPTSFLLNLPSCSAATVFHL